MSSTVDMVGYWLAQAGRYPLLTPAQEILLGSTVQAWLHAENPDARTIKRGQKAKDKMILSNLRLPIAICKKYRTRIESSCAVSMDDLLQESVLGLSRAVEKFDPTAGYKFSTYAYWWIRQAVSRFFEISQSPIKASSAGAQIAMRWRYKPEGMTIEEFAEKEKRSVKNCLEYIENVRRTEVCSLDVQLKSDESGSSLLDMQSDYDPGLEVIDWTDAVEGLQEIDEIKDAMALVDLSMQTRPMDMAEFLECSTNAVSKKVRDAKSVIREHAPSHIRERICGIERKLPAIMNSVIPLHEPSPAKELALISCCSASQHSMPDAIAQPSTNGHQSLEQEAVAVIHAVRSESIAEASEEAVKPTKRRRRSAAELQAVKAESTISVTVDGLHLDGKADHIARLLCAMKQTA